jgi:hypothetical protein
LTVRHTAARTLDGVLAKANLNQALTDQTSQLDAEYFLEDEYPLDPELIGQSVCRDLMQFAGCFETFKPSCS